LSRWVSWAAGLIVAFAIAGGAVAAPKPSYDKPPKWVDVAAVPEAPPAEGAAAVQVVLDDNQSRLDPSGDAYFNRRISKILKPEGLAGLTTFSLSWNPDNQFVTIHWLRVIRDGKTIDLLQKGKHMLVLRREEDLERAMLDGRMTASQQLQGLQVGDVIDVAWTQGGRDPVIGNRSYDAEGLVFAGVAARYRMRLSFPTGAPIRWKPTEGFGQPQVSQKDGRTFLDLDLTNVSAPKQPIGAPLRYRRLGSMETSGFGSWQEISQLMAPLYARASTLSADSPIKAEAAAIAASTADPKARAFAALRLVEDKTRYFFIGMGDGGYVPARADETWTRRFGDCKGKTVLLLSLLRELGVQAEPALVSLGGGDGMNERLPSMAAFNHVIVRATIDGKVYWLDGTRTGDRSGLEALRPPSHRWALPVRAEGADLEEIAVPPLTAPMLDITMQLDASKGLDAPAPVRITQVFRGDAANAMRQMAASRPRADLEREVRQRLSGTMSWITLSGMDWKDDAENDAFRIFLTGSGDLEWRKNPDLGVMEYKVSASAGSNSASSYPRREPGPNRDAPYAVPYPNYVRQATEVSLPQSGKGFTVRGPNGVDTIGALELKRASVIQAGVASFVTEMRSLKPEISAEEAEVANRQLRRLAAEDSLIRAPL